jgi:signal transduction histidine kinase
MTEESQIIQIVLIATGILLLISLSVIIFVFAYNRKLAAKQAEIDHLEAQFQRNLLDAEITTKENEQKRIARELHDDIGSRLNAVRLMLKQPYTDHQLITLDEQITSISKSLRKISNDLMPATLDAIGLKRSLRELLTNIGKTGELNTTNDLDALDDIHLSDQINLSIYRVIQELLNNILKHAHASTVHLSAHRINDTAIIELVDDGKGFLPTRANFSTENKQMGLKNIASRLQYIHATIHFEQNIPHGTRVTINLKNK